MINRGMLCQHIRQLKGYSVKSVASDPSNTQRGQIWYNRTSKQIKFTGNVGGVFASGGNLNTARWNSRATVGTQTAGNIWWFNCLQELLCETEEYDGTSWTEVTDIFKKISNGGGGIQTALFSSGGNTSILEKTLHLIMMGLVGQTVLTFCFGTSSSMWNTNSRNTLWWNTKYREITKQIKQRNMMVHHGLMGEF